MRALALLSLVLISCRFGLMEPIGFVYCETHHCPDCSKLPIPPGGNGHGWSCEGPPDHYEPAQCMIPGGDPAQWGCAPDGGWPDGWRPVGEEWPDDSDAGSSQLYEEP